MAQSKEDMLTKVEQANHEAERAYWWMKGVDRETAERLDVLGQVSEVLKLLQKARVSLRHFIDFLRVIRGF